MADERRQPCQRCEKSGYVCRGYERKLRVRFHSFVPAKDISASNATAQTHSLATNVIGIRDNQCFAAITRATSIPHNVSLIAFKDDIQYSFLFSNLVWCHYGSPWLQQSALGRLGVLALEACQAFSFKAFGQHHRLTDVELDGARHYGMAVRKLSSRLSTVGAPGSEDLLIPIMILLLQSVSRRPASIPAQSCIGLIRKSPWKTVRRHLPFISRLCTSCCVYVVRKPSQLNRSVAPLKVAEPHWYVLHNELCLPKFTIAEMAQITVALITKSQTFLEDEAWAMGPWSCSADSRMRAQNELIDVLAHVPGFLRDQEEFRETGDESLRQSLVRNITKQLSATSAWRAQWEKLNPDTVSCGMNHDSEYPLLGLVESQPFAKVLVCSSWRQATEICLHNAVVLSLRGILWSLEPLADDLVACHRRSPSSPVLLPNQVSSLEQVAGEISRVFESQLVGPGSQDYGLCPRYTRLSACNELDSTCSGRGSAPLNAVLRGIWVRLWPPFPLI